MGLRYEDYEATRTVPNIVVDGTGNASTVLILSHWPGQPTPGPLRRDLSAEIAFAYLAAPHLHADVEVVTNNHFDQDGLVSVYALVAPDAALAQRDLLIGIAAAGDFGTYTDRRAARASMVIARWSDAGLSYTETLPRLADLIADLGPYRDLWADEDAHLARSEAAITSGAVVFVEHPELDLAVVTSVVAPTGRGHRFAHLSTEGIHPMAINNATGCFRVLIIAGRQYRFVDRYETWVTYQSRPTLPRVDMRPLATALAELDPDAGWQAGAPEDLEPQLCHSGPSVLDAGVVTDLVIAHLHGRGA